MPARRILLSLFVVTFSILAVAQDHPPRTELAFWFGGSFENGHAFSNTINARLYQVEGRYARLAYARGPVSVRYVAEITPLEFVGDPHLTGQRVYPHGAGASPLGAQVNLVHFRRFQPFLASSGGFLYFSRRMFSEGATQFNFTAHLTGGIEMFTPSRREAIDFGYRYHHISNANMNHSNPALDSHVLFVGVSFFR